MHKLLLNKTEILVSFIVIFSSWIIGRLSAKLMGLLDISHFEWYTISVVLVKELIGDQAATTIFCINVIRELHLLALHPSCTHMPSKSYVWVLENNTHGL